MQQQQNHKASSCHHDKKSASGGHEVLAKDIKSPFALQAGPILTLGIRLP